MNKNKRSLDEEIKRLKYLSLIKETDELDQNITKPSKNPTSKEAEDKIDLIFNTPEFENEISDAMSMFAKDLPNQLRLIGVGLGDNDGNVESGGIKTVNNDGQTTTVSLNDISLVSIGFKEALKPTRMTQLLGSALRNSGINFDMQSLRNISNKLSKLGREANHNYFRSVYNGIKPIIGEMSDDQKIEFTGKLLLGGLLIASVWSIQAIINAFMAGKDIKTAKYKANDIFNAIKLNLPRWIGSLTKFDLY